MFPVDGSTPLSLQKWMDHQEPPHRLDRHKQNLKPLSEQAEETPSPTKRPSGFRASQAAACGWYAWWYAVSEKQKAALALLLYSVEAT